MEARDNNLTRRQFLLMMALSVSGIPEALQWPQESELVEVNSAHAIAVEFARHDQAMGINVYQQTHEQMLQIVRENKDKKGMSDVRTLRVVMGREMADVIRTRGKDTLGTDDPVLWWQAHIQFLNETLANSGIGWRKVELQKQILVAPDQLIHKPEWQLLEREAPDASHKSHWRNVKLSTGEIIPLHPGDDYTIFRGKDSEHPLYPTNAAYLTEVNMNGQQIRIDGGWAHEIIHVLFFSPDLYHQSGLVSGEKQIGFRHIHAYERDNMSSPTKGLLTPATRGLVEPIIGRNGPYSNWVSSQAEGIIRDVAGRDINPLWLSPPHASIRFIDQNGQEMSLENPNQVVVYGIKNPAPNRPDIGTIKARHDVWDSPWQNTIPITKEMLHYELEAWLKPISASPTVNELAKPDKSVFLEPDETDRLSAHWVGVDMGYGWTLPFPTMAVAMIACENITKDRNQIAPEDTMFNIVWRKDPKLAKPVSEHIWVEMMQGIPARNVESIMATAKIPGNDNYYIVWSDKPLPQVIPVAAETDVIPKPKLKDKVLLPDIRR